MKYKLVFDLKQVTEIEVEAGDYDDALDKLKTYANDFALVYTVLDAYVRECGKQYVADEKAFDPPIIPSSTI